MKFDEYITEASKFELKLYGIIKSLNKDCKPFINEIRKSGNKLLWRGSKKVSTKAIIRVTPRQDRIPKDMPEFLQDELDREFLKNFGWKPRSTGVFVTANKRESKSYGDSYMFFPVGKYKYLYDPYIVDLFGEVEDNEASGFDDLQDYLSSKTMIGKKNGNMITVKVAKEVGIMRELIQVK